MLNFISKCFSAKNIFVQTSIFLCFSVLCDCAEGRRNLFLHELLETNNVWTNETCEGSGGEGGVNVKGLISF